MARNVPHSAISACLIVRNEERTLERCLASLSGAVDDLVVLDTGSSDATCAIARRHGARLYHAQWADDFAAARNASLAHAKGDWVLWVDADEELVEAQPGALRRLCQTASADVWGYWLGVRCPYGASGEQEMRLSQWRLFRNRRDIAFHGRVHEQPEPPHTLERWQLPDQAAVSLVHHGYATSAQVMAAKLERNRRLMEQCIAEEPRDPFQRFNLGRQLVRESRWAEGLAELERAIALWQQGGAPAARYVHLLFAFAAQGAVELGRYERALEIEAQAGPTFASADLLCETGLACWKLGRHADALVRLTQCFS
ncbi:MAG: glycosyltransferase, partial [Chloroflexota bacterium]